MRDTILYNVPGGGCPSLNEPLSLPSPKSKIHDTHLLVIDRFFFYFVKLRFDGKKDLTKESDGRTDKGRGDLMPPPQKNFYTTRTAANIK